MFRKLQKNEQGFTIIEVLIVLAIAGLIMLIVFLAIPALQRSQRNGARNTEASRISAAITECLANRNGQKASCDATADISVGTLQQLAVPATFSDNAATDLGTGSTSAVVAGYQRRCTADGSNDEAGGTRDFAVMYQLEPAVNRCIGSQTN